jgi:hypothetical protein
MRNLSAITLRLPLATRIFITFPFNNFADLRGRLPGEAHLVSAHDYGTCSAMDQSLILGMSAIVRRDEQRNRRVPAHRAWQYAGYE